MKDGTIAELQEQLERVGEEREREGERAADLQRENSALQVRKRHVCVCVFSLKQTCIIILWCFCYILYVYRMSWRGCSLKVG